MGADRDTSACGSVRTSASCGRRWRADRKMHRAQRIADQYDVFIAPATVDHRFEVQPLRSVRKERMPAQIIAKDLLAIPAALFIGHSLESGLNPGVRVTFDDERAGRRAVAVMMRDK